LCKLYFPVYKYYKNNNEAVVWASGGGHLATVQYLVNQGADVTAEDNRVVRWASMDGHLATVQYLVNQGADVTAQDNQAVAWASEDGHLATVQYLVTQGADVARIEPTMWKNMCATRIQQFYKRPHTRRKLWKVLKEVIPLYYHPQAKGGYFARKALLECL
jgi:ABC-type phosphate/phosphonate transport system substrate-binding protein